MVNSILIHTMLVINVILIVGESHRKQRKLLNPVFHINHMRHMSPIFYRTIHRVC